LLGKFLKIHKVCIILPCSRNESLIQFVKDNPNDSSSRLRFPSRKIMTLYGLRKEKAVVIEQVISTCLKIYEKAKWKEE